MKNTLPYSLLTGSFLVFFVTISLCCPTCIGYPHAQQVNPFLSVEDIQSNDPDSPDESHIAKNIYEKEIDPPVFHGLPPDEQ